MASSCGWPQLWHPPCHTTAARALEDVVGRQELHSQEDGQQDFMRMTAGTPCPSSSSVSLIDPFFTGYLTATSSEDWAVILGPERAPPVACCWLTRVHLENISILGDIAAGKEQTFGTLTVCLLTWIGG